MIWRWLSALFVVGVIGWAIVGRKPEHGCTPGIPYNPETQLCQQSADAPIAGAPTAPVDVDPPAASYQTPEATNAAIADAFSVFDRDPKSEWLRYDPTGFALFQKEFALVYQGTKNTQSFLEIMEQARGRVLFNYTPIDRAEALHRAEVRVNNARVAQQGQLNALWQQQQMQAIRQQQQAAYVQQERQVQITGYNQPYASRSTYADTPQRSTSNYSSTLHRYSTYDESPSAAGFQQRPATQYADPSGRPVRRAFGIGDNLYKDLDTGEKHFTYDRGDGVQQAYRRPIDTFNQVGDALNAD